MPLRAGDTVTTSVNPTIRITKYDSVKPFASVSRVLSDDVAGDLKDLRDQLVLRFYESLKVELELLNDTSSYVVDGDVPQTIEQLLALCKKKLGDVNAHAYHTTEAGEEAPAPAPKPKSPVAHTAPAKVGGPKPKPQIKSIFAPKG